MPPVAPKPVQSGTSRRPSARRKRPPTSPHPILHKYVRLFLTIFRILTVRPGVARLPSNKFGREDHRHFSTREFHRSYSSTVHDFLFPPSALRMQAAGGGGATSTYLWDDGYSFSATLRYLGKENIVQH